MIPSLVLKIMNMIMHHTCSCNRSSIKSTVIFNLNTNWKAVHTWNKKKRNLLITLIHLKSYL